MPVKWSKKAMGHLTALADTIKADELKQLAAEEILHRLYHEETLRLFDTHALSPAHARVNAVPEP